MLDLKRQLPSLVDLKEYSLREFASRGQLQAEKGGKERKGRLLDIEVGSPADKLFLWALLSNRK